MRKVMERLFNQFPINLIQTENGQEVIDIISKDQVDLIFMDFNMPVLDG